jgi:hypothetical protein
LVIVCRFCPKFLWFMVVYKISANGFRLGEGGDFKSKHS